MKGILPLLLLMTGCTSAEQKTADAIKAEVAAKMKEPESARFSKLKLRLAELCGEVNFKNSFGAYIGAQQFIGVTGSINLRSQAEIADTLAAGSLAAKQNGSWVERFDRDYQICQKDGVSVH